MQKRLLLSCVFAAAHYLVLFQGKAEVCAPPYLSEGLLQRKVLCRVQQRLVWAARRFGFRRHFVRQGPNADRRTGTVHSAAADSQVQTVSSSEQRHYCLLPLCACAHVTPTAETMTGWLPVIFHSFRENTTFSHPQHAISFKYVFYILCCTLPTDYCLESARG